MSLHPLCTSASERLCAKRCPWILNATCLLLCLMLMGCTLGPRQLQGNRFDYNISIQRSDNQELLLNFVRLRYTEVPCFMQVSSVTSTFEYSMALQAQAQWAKGDFYDQFPMRFISPLIRGGYSENPTISYSPLSGEKFVSKLLTPVSAQRFWFLHRSGWEIDLLMHLLVTKLGKLHNPAPYEYHDPKTVEAEMRFKKFARLLRKFQRRNDFALVVPTAPEKSPFSLLMELRFENTAEARSFADLLRVKLPLTTLPDGRLLGQIYLSTKGGFSQLQALHLGGPILRVRFRNFIGVLVNLLNGVETPPGEAEEGGLRGDPESPSEKDPSSRPFRILVHCANAFPTNVYVGIKYRDHCFFISDQDFISKNTFSFIAMLLALQSGDVKSTKPVLTLPVGVPSSR